jgi:hypothetical protein
MRFERAKGPVPKNRGQGTLKTSSYHRLGHPVTRAYHARSRATIQIMNAALVDPLLVA